MSASSLKNKNCVPCDDKSVAPLTHAEASKLVLEIVGWDLAKNAKSISKDYEFKDFDKAMDFVNMVADTAELEGHHPDITINYNKVMLVCSTHTIKGLSENDFILAAKIDSIHL